uniref:Uncharacterized protein n=1 Tax=Romanomermis culicivorax TaxID=13658 RepID=A0A915IB75_ROMCU
CLVHQNNYVFVPVGKDSLAIEDQFILIFAPKNVALGVGIRKKLKSNTQRAMPVFHTKTIEGILEPVAQQSHIFLAFSFKLPYKNGIRNTQILDIRNA